MRRVVITGIGVVSPIGIGAEAFWKNLLAGACGIKPIALFDPAKFPVRVAGQVPEYKISEFVPKSYRKATKVMARDTEIAVIAADAAFRDSNIKSKAYGEAVEVVPQRFGCNIGAALISAELNELTAAMTTAKNGDALDLKAWGGHGMTQLTPLWLLKYLPNMLACHVTIIHELKGPSNTITCQDASSHLAIGEAFRTIQRGCADLAICGGAESRINPMGIIRQCLLNRMATGNNDAPEKAVRPFDKNAAGSVLGEGGGLFILEELEHAKARNAKIYAELAGFGATQDAYKIDRPDPSGAALSNAVNIALNEARASADQVGCIVPHGLGIPDFDAAELNAYKKSFGGKLKNIPFAPIKSQIGNLAAGCGVDAAAAVLCAYSNQVPPAVNTENPELSVAPQARQSTVEVSLSTVYSLGGQNAALAFKKYTGN